MNLVMIFEILVHRTHALVLQVLNYIYVYSNVNLRIKTKQDSFVFPTSDSGARHVLVSVIDWSTEDWIRLSLQLTETGACLSGTFRNQVRFCRYCSRESVFTFRKIKGVQQLTYFIDRLFSCSSIFCFHLII